MLEKLHSPIIMDQYPFSHIIIDDFLSEPFLTHILELFPKNASKVWKSKENKTSNKCYINDLEKYSELQYDLLSNFNNYKWVQKFEKLSGIEPLIGDPYLIGGGFHKIEREGFLKIHADFNIHPKLWLIRKLNVLIYLNEDWKDEWGGHLELWDYRTRECVKKIAPVMNRMVLFETSRQSLHGHPNPLKCPEGVCRKSIALYYYYTKELPTEERHATLYI